MKIRAVTYSRYSSDQQRESSISDQQRNIHQRAKAEGWDIVKDYADAAESGSSNQRKQYLAVIDAGVRGEYEVLMVDDLSRLTRDSLEQERVIRKLEFAKIRIISIADGYDSTSKSRKLQRGFKGMMNEMFLDDLAAKVHRGQTGQALLGRWNGGKPYGYRLRRIVDDSKRDQYGEPLRIGTELVVDAAQSQIVLEMFARFVEGESCGAIASDLNARNVPSSGSTWNRKVRRCEKWVSSAVRGMVANPLYTGRVRWNRRNFVRNPETGSYVARVRPESEHIVVPNESLRIVSDQVFESACARLNRAKNEDTRLKHGGRKKFVLSGLLRCAVCGRSYITADARAYACGSFLSGGIHACSNKMRVRRDSLEKLLLEPICNDLLDPDRVVARAKKIMADMRHQGAPRSSNEIDELEARIKRLRVRLRDGDPDLTADELLAAIKSAESKRTTLFSKPATPLIPVFGMLQKAAERYREEIRIGLSGSSERDAARAREVIHAMLGTISLRPDEEGLWAESTNMVDDLLVRTANAGSRAGAWTNCQAPAWTFGRDDRI